jgi:hypothetical protein
MASICAFNSWLVSGPQAARVFVTDARKCHIFWHFPPHADPKSGFLTEVLVRVRPRAPPPEHRHQSVRHRAGAAARVASNSRGSARNNEQAMRPSSDELRVVPRARWPCRSSGAFGQKWLMRGAGQTASQAAVASRITRREGARTATIFRAPASASPGCHGWIATYSSVRKCRNKQLIQMRNVQTDIAAEFM